MPRIPRRGERWREITNYPLYEVSDYGRVRSCKRRTPRILSPCRDQFGYARARLWNDEGNIWRYVHALVLEAFIGPCPEGMECCHGTMGPKIDKLCNLSWGNRHKNNGTDKIRDGTTSRGVKNPKDKLSEDDIYLVRKLLVEGNLSQEKIGAVVGVGQVQISRIKRGQHWGWLGKERK